MACTDYPNEEFWRAIGDLMVRDAVLCPFQAQMGGVVFATFVILGMINLPIYIRQDNVVGPFVLTLLLGGILVPQMSSLGQGLVIGIGLFVIGLGPILVLRRVQGAV